MIFWTTCRNALRKYNSGIAPRNFHDGRYVSVREFYKNRNVFITGCTGFVGQGLLEKLLRSCPEIGKVYLPIRAKRKTDAYQRYEQLLNKDVFSRLRSTNSSFADKLVPLPAVLEDSNFGLTDDVFRTLTEDVSVIFNVAALIKFNPPLREAISSNVLVSRNVFRFGQQCKNLAAYVHVSSIYAHIDRDYVSEKIYPTTWDHNQLVNMMDTPQELSSKTSEIVDSSPGTYFSTKKVAEYMTQQEAGSSPVAVVRLGKVSPSVREPAPGWMHGHGSYIPLMKLVEAGQLRVILGSRDNTINLVPADMCSNSLVTIGWYIGTKQGTKHANVQQNREPLVVNVHNTQENMLTAKQFVSYINQYLKQEGYTTSVFLHPSKLLLLLKTALPTLYYTIIDLIKGRMLLCLGFQMFMFMDKGAYKIQVLNNPKEYTNLPKIEAVLNDSDKKEFPLDFDKVNWEEYTQLWLRTAREKRVTKDHQRSEQCKLKAVQVLQEHASVRRAEIDR